MSKTAPRHYTIAAISQHRPNSTGWCAAEFLTKQENADNQARRSIKIVDSAENVFEPVGDFTVKVANADVGDS